jgi:2-dehydropantoate 2-reductase
MGVFQQPAGQVRKEGYDISMIDQWPAHVEAMKTNGLRITMADEELHLPVQAVHLCDVCSLRQEFDVVFLTAISYDSCWITEFIKPHLKPDGVLVSLQNS